MTVAVALFALAMIGAALVCASCANMSPTPNAPSTRVELLGFDGCPNTPVLRDRLRKAMGAIDSPSAFRDVDLADLPNSDPRRGFPAPTILVDGVDLFDPGMVADRAGQLSCRAFPDGMPSVELIEELLRERFEQ